MNTKVIRYPLNEVENRLLAIEAEKACRRPEQHARWLLRQALGLTKEQKQEQSVSNTEELALA